MPDQGGYGTVGAERGAVRTALEQRYAAGGFEADAMQRKLADRLDRLELDLRSSAAAGKKSALGWLFARSQAAAKPRGVYIHGKVGRGKSMLMDLFFEKSRVARKRRVHFHAFMGEVQDRIGAHRAALKSGEATGDDPIAPVAARIAEETRLLCFDEFTVTDIADAMILSRLFEALFAHGVTLVATSNVAPDDLYRDGLNRPLFLPFVTLLKAHADVVEVDAPTDYRLRSLGGDRLYLTPLTAETEGEFDGLWRSLTAGNREEPRDIGLRGRTIAVPRASGRLARFEAPDLLSRALGAADFVALAEAFDTVFVDGLTPMGEGERNEAKRFIILVDALYDRGRRIVIRAAVPADKLYTGRRGTEAFEFDRTVSRLVEMRSEGYGAP